MHDIDQIPNYRGYRFGVEDETFFFAEKDNLRIFFPRPIDLNNDGVVKDAIVFLKGEIDREEKKNAKYTKLFREYTQRTTSST